MCGKCAYISMIKLICTSCAAKTSGEASDTGHPGVCDYCGQTRLVASFAPTEESPLKVLRDHMVKVRDYGYWFVHPADVIALIDLAEAGKLKGLKVGLEP